MQMLSLGLSWASFRYNAHTFPSGAATLRAEQPFVSFPNFVRLQARTVSQFSRMREARLEARQLSIFAGVARAEH